MQAFLKFLGTLLYLFQSKPKMNVPSLPSDPISAGLDVAAEGLALGIQVDAEMNTPEMIQAARDKEKQKLKDNFNEALEKGDTETLRKLIAGL